MRDLLYYGWCKWRGHACVAVFDEEPGVKTVRVVDWCWRCHRGLPTSFVATMTSGVVDA